MLVDLAKEELDMLVFIFTGLKPYANLVELQATTFPKFKRAIHDAVAMGPAGLRGLLPDMSNLRAVAATAGWKESFEDASHYGPSSRPQASHYSLIVDLCIVVYCLVVTVIGFIMYRI